MPCPTNTYISCNGIKTLYYKKQHNIPLRRMVLEGTEVESRVCALATPRRHECGLVTRNAGSDRV
jgi:hypothetical protein